MADYRGMLYRYSTGIGPNASMDMPERSAQQASFSLYPQTFRLSDPEFSVEIKREADRVSLQVEDAQRIISNLGSDPKAVQQLQVLKDRLNLITDLMLNYPVTYIKIKDLDILHDLKSKKSPDLNMKIREVVEYNRKNKGNPRLIGDKKFTPKGKRLYDQYGREIKRGLSDYSGVMTSNTSLVVMAVVAGLLGGWLASR